MDTTWMDDALCAEADPRVFTSDSRGKGAIRDDRAAKALCARCGVAAECFAYSLQIGADYGVWGGVSARERVADEAFQQRPVSDFVGLHNLILPDE